MLPFRLAKQRMHLGPWSSAFKRWLLSGEQGTPLPFYWLGQLPV